MKKIKNDQQRELLTGLLQRDPQKRLGRNGTEEIKEHAFFASINWDLVASKQMAPPYMPEVYLADEG